MKYAGLLSLTHTYLICSSVDSKCYSLITLPFNLLFKRSLNTLSSKIMGFYHTNYKLCPLCISLKKHSC